MSTIYLACSLAGRSGSNASNGWPSRKEMCSSSPASGAWPASGRPSNEDDIQVCLRPLILLGGLKVIWLRACSITATACRGREKVQQHTPCGTVCLARGLGGCTCSLGPAKTWHRRTSDAEVWNLPPKLCACMVLTLPTAAAAALVALAGVQLASSAWCMLAARSSRSTSTNQHRRTSTNVNQRRSWGNSALQRGTRGAR